MNERQNAHLVFAFENVIQHSIAVEHEQFTEAGIVFFGHDSTAIGELFE